MPGDAAPGGPGGVAAPRAQRRGDKLRIHLPRNLANRERAYQVTCGLSSQAAVDEAIELPREALDIVWGGQGTA